MLTALVVQGEDHHSLDAAIHEWWFKEKERFFKEQGVTKDPTIISVIPHRLQKIGSLANEYRVIAVLIMYHYI